MVLYPKDPHYKIHFDIAPATAIMIGISPPGVRAYLVAKRVVELNRKSALLFTAFYLNKLWFLSSASICRNHQR